MKKLHFDYYMQIDYSVPVAKCNFTIKCIPKNNIRQNISDIKIDIHPPVKYSYGKDGLKNEQIYGANENEHDTFYFRIEGTAVVGMNDYEEAADEDLDMIFKHPYGLNIAGKSIKKYLNQIRPSDDLNALTKAIDVMHNLHKDFKYKQFVTDINTSAEQAFSSGEGVCQDYAHIFISLMHLLNIPARYVTGLLIGEGQSHAWVEILMDDKWYGLDPTNDSLVVDSHIKLGVGRDAHDCMINRGIMHGGGLHTQTIKVSVTEIE